MTQKKSKPFSEMSQSEIDALTDEEFKAVSPFEKKSCHDCVHLKSAMSWWCGNEEAKKARGTSIPGCIKCPHWGPNWKYIDDEFKTEANGYKAPKQEPIKEETSNEHITGKRWWQFWKR